MLWSAGNGISSLVKLAVFRYLYAILQKYWQPFNRAILYPSSFSTHLKINI